MENRYSRRRKLLKRGLAWKSIQNYGSSRRHARGKEREEACSNGGRGWETFLDGRQMRNRWANRLSRPTRIFDWEGSGGNKKEEVIFVSRGSIACAFSRHGDRKFALSTLRCTISPVRGSFVGKTWNPAGDRYPPPPPYPPPSWKSATDTAVLRRKKEKKKKKREKSAQMETKIYVFVGRVEGGDEVSDKNARGQLFTRRRLIALRDKKRTDRGRERIKGGVINFEMMMETLSRYAANFVTDKQTLPLSLGRRGVASVFKVERNNKPSLPCRLCWKGGVSNFDSMTDASSLPGGFSFPRGKSFLSGGSSGQWSGELSPVLLSRANGYLLIRFRRKRNSPSSHRFLNSSCSCCHASPLKH